MSRKPGKGSKTGTSGTGASGTGASGARGSARSAVTRFTQRSLTEKVRTAKGRKLSSTKWLQRQINDPYVVEARARGYRSRAAFKLLELDDQFRILRPGARVVDLGAAPGGWTQVAVERVGSNKTGPKAGRVIGLDINEMEEVAGATLLLQDFLEPEAPDLLKAALDGTADVVLSDMAAPASGHPATDHIRIMALCEIALEFAEEILSPGGSFIAKVLQGGTENEMLAHMKKLFKTVKHAKPPASRSDSAEMYVVAMGFRGRKAPATPPETPPGNRDK
ncbi:MAG: RlmE family RNA methyltransferase [Rhodospirillales bacterium]|nr:RlmE family RNA methyltransferase [Rhodospirillales bacterium]